MNRPRVLVIDDENGPRVSVRFSLSHSCHVKEAEIPQDGLKFVREENFDIVIVDLHMPGAHGFDVIKEIRRIDPHVACVILTADATIETRLAARGIGIHSFLTKPFDLSTLRELVDNCTAYTRSARSQAPAKSPL